MSLAVSLRIAFAWVRHPGLVACAGLLAFSVRPLAAAAEPRYQLNPDITVGGFSLTLANGDDTTSDFVPQGCTLTNPAVGVVQIHVTAPDSALEVPLAAMAGSAGYGFDAATFVYLRLRWQAGTNVTGGFAVEWATQVAGQGEVTGRVTVPHQPGRWAVHQLDFRGVPGWQGQITRLRLHPLTAAADVGKAVRLDRLELVADDRSDEAFGLKPVLLRVIQRHKSADGVYRCEWEDIAKYTKTPPANAAELDGRIYYFAKDGAADRLPVYRYFNATTRDYLETTDAPPAGYAQKELLGHVWKQPHPAMSPVRRAVNRATGRHALITSTETLPGYEPEATLGYAYARAEKPLQEYEHTSDKLDDIFYLRSGQVRFGVNLDHGAAGWHWFHGDKQMINISDFGRQLQLSYYFSGFNPSEVGFGRGQVGNPVAHVYSHGHRLVTRTVPIDWNFKNITRVAGTITNPDMFPGIMLGKEVTFGILGHAHLAKWTAYLHTPEAIGTQKGQGSQLEIISNHPTADFVYRANVDFDARGKLIITGTKTNTRKAGGGDNEDTFYNYPKAGIGGNISALGPGDDQLAFGLLVGTYFADKSKGVRNWSYEFAGEKRLGSSRHVNISMTSQLGARFGDPFNGQTTAQRSVMRSPTVAGDNRYVGYLMSGTVAEVKRYMQDLYDHRDQLEW